MAIAYDPDETHLAPGGSGRTWEIAEAAVVSSNGRLLPAREGP